MCDGSFISEHDTANVCSPECRRASERVREKAKRARRRARLSTQRAEAGIHETGTAMTKSMRQILLIVERDGDMCAICSKHVDLTIVDGLHDNAPSRDHKVPKSRGGKNGIDNMQLAHRKCNIKRGNKRLPVH
jgi:5-methylcytosine-specific restriction endonuclease McrA